jgi:hypothetical protein
VLKRAEAAGSAPFRLSKGPKMGKIKRFPEKNQEKPQKPVETGVFLLTNAAESRRVNGGRFFRTRVITGYRRTAAHSGGSTQQS